MSILNEPVVIVIVIQIVALLIAKFDESNTIADFIIKLAEKLKS